MVKNCAVVQCQNSKSSKEATVFGFPKDEEQFRAWIDSIGPMLRNVDLKSDNNGLCHLHFKVTDYINPSSQKKRLKLNAVPVFTTQQLLSSTQTSLGTAIPATQPCASNCLEVIDACRKKIIDLERAIEYQKKLIQRRDTTIKDLTKALELANVQQSAYKTNFEEAQSRIDNLLPLTNYLTTTFSPAQIKLIRNGSVRSWDPIDIANAIGLYCVSSRGYAYLRQKLNYPLPSKTTLLRWLSKVDVRPGVLAPVLRVLERKMRDAPPIERACILGFDEMSIDDRYAYDAYEDRVYGGEKLMSGLFARGLFSNWKQIVHYDMGKKLTTELLMEIIEKLHHSHCDVLGIVCDLGSKNRALWRDLHVCRVRQGQFVSRTSIDHPLTKRRIWMFADFPHMLKLFRNHLIDDGLTLPDKTVINKKLLEDLIEAQKSELKLTHKVTYKHIYARGKQRQKVRPAFELFSNKVANAIKVLFPQKKSEAEFFKKINDFSDLMNVHTAEKSRNDSKCPYGMKLESQERSLCEFYHDFSKIQFGTRNQGSYFPFQMAILASIRSLIGLYEDVVESLNMCYIITAHLNQDYIENSFGFFRGIGNFNLNPNGAQVTHRIRRGVVGKNFHRSRGSNTQAEDNECFMTSDAFELLTQNDSANEVNESWNQLTCKLFEATSTIRTETIREETSLADLRMSNICEEGGIEYVAGFISMKFMEKYPYLSRPLSEQTTENALWLRKISDGGLVEPSTLWFGQFTKFEEFFDALHTRNSICMSPGVVKSISSVLVTKFPDIPEDLICYYARVRTHIRISSLNKQIEGRKFKGQEQYHQWKKNSNAMDLERETLPRLEEEDEEANNDSEEILTPQDSLQNELVDLLEYSNY